MTLLACVGVRGRSAALREAVRCGLGLGDGGKSRKLSSDCESFKSRMNETEFDFSTTALTQGDGGGDSRETSCTLLSPFMPSSGDRPNLDLRLLASLLEGDTFPDGVRPATLWRHTERVREKRAKTRSVPPEMF